MVGAVSFQPYVSSYQYTGYSRMRLAGQDAAAEPAQSVSAAPSAQAHAASAEKAGNTESLIGARSLTDAGSMPRITGAAVRAADPETPVEPVDAVSRTQSGAAGHADYIPFMRAGMDPAELAVRMRMEYVDVAQPGKESSAKGAETELPGMGSKEAQAVEWKVPGVKSEDTEAVQLDLPGTKAAGTEAAAGFPGTSADKVAESGLPGASSEAEPAEVSGKDSGEDAPKAAGMGTGVEDTQKTMNETECKTCKERKYQDGSDDPGVSFKTPTHVDPKQASAAVRGHELEHVVRERAQAEKEGRRVISQSVTMQTGICPECGRVYTAGGVTRTVTAADTKPQEAPKDPKWILMNSAA